MRADNSRYLRAAAQQRQAEALSKAVAAPNKLRDERRPITFQAVAKEAGVSRGYLYTEHRLRSRIEEARQTMTPAPAAPRPRADVRASDSSLLQRLEQAHQRIRKLRSDNEQLRKELAHALGRTRCRCSHGDQPNSQH
ncbi:DUF6262 family protein [Kineococcus sp. SYSU DK005]|uniref:DUF6262 family protein n=1 Tax=Kineococcus sp. SYSU DK005 TaxID=3383126 RepID=UPI003D7CB153